MAAKKNLTFEQRIELWKQNPVEFITTNWNVIVWNKLEDICNSVRDNPVTVVPSGHGVGKSFISAHVILWWLFTHQPSKVITTAPTWAQVESVLWGEIRAAVQSCKIPLCDSRDVLNTEIKLAPDWFAQGISTSETVEQREYGSTKFQGFHSPNLLVVMDEAPGVHRSIHTAVKTLATGANNRVLKIGNPTSPSGEFFNDCFSGTAKKITISCFDHPNVKEGKELIPGAVTKEWIQRMKDEWGEHSPLYKAKVLGEFPDETEDTLIPLSWCEIATSAEVEPNQSSVLGIDTARFGDDKGQAYEVKSNIVKHIFQTTKEDTMQQAGRVVNIHENYQTIFVDDTGGWGGGLIDRVREILNSSLDPASRKGSKIVGINFGEKALQPERFFNKRAEMYWNLRERLNPEAEQYIKIRLPDDDDLKSQLASMKFTYTSTGKIKLEDKDEIKKRIGKSPDKADGLVLAVWAARPEKPEQIITNSVYKEFLEMKRRNLPGSRLSKSFG